MKAPHALIIGGSRGIGRAVVVQLSEEGMRVSAIGRNLPGGQSQRVRGARYWKADVRDPDFLSRTLRDVLRTQGKINHLIFLQRYRGEGDAWQDELDVSLTATKEIVDALSESFAAGERSIVIVSSINASYISPYLSIGYHAVKAALQQMVRFWAVSLGEKGIRVNAVSPGTVLKAESRKFFLQDRSLAAFYRSITPLRRFGEASEVARIISFLCGKGSSFVTGQNIVVDGGVSLQWQETLARDVATIPPSPRKVTRGRKK